VGLRDAAVGGGGVGDHDLALLRRQRHRSEPVGEAVRGRRLRGEWPSDSKSFFSYRDQVSKLFARLRNG